MCVLCVEIQKQKMTIREVARAYAETEEKAFNDGHVEELLDVVDATYGVDALTEELTKGSS